MTLKRRKTSGRFKVTSPIVITLNLEFNSTCRRKKQSLFHWNTLMFPELLILIWICYKKNELTIIGMSIRADICQFLGEVPQSSLLWKRNFQKDVCCPGWRLTKMETNAKSYYVWPAVWTNICKAAQNPEKQEWATRKVKARQSLWNERLRSLNLHPRRISKQCMGVK